MLTKVSRYQRGTRDLWNWLITTPIHTIKLTGKVNRIIVFAWWCLTPLSTILQLYRGGTEYPEKATDLSQVLVIMLYTPLWSRLELTTSVVIGTDCIGKWIWIFWKLPKKGFQNWTMKVGGLWCYQDVIFFVDTIEQTTVIFSCLDNSNSYPLRE
jgi:hypothetical protein